MKKYSTKSQNKMLLEAMANGNSVTRVGAMVNFSCLNLPARVFELRNYWGVPVKCDYGHVNGSHYASYYISAYALKDLVCRGLIRWDERTGQYIAVGW